MLWKRAAPWVTPAGLRDYGHERTQGLVALAGLRTLGFEKGRPAGACPAARQPANELDYRGIIPHPALHGIKRLRYRKGPLCGKGPCCGSPLQGFGVVGTSEPRVWSPLQGYAPWALERVAPLGLAPPPGNWPRSTTYKIVIPHPALDKDKRATLWVAPLGLRDCGRGRTPTAAQAPAGRPFPEPRVRSPARATKPWVSQPSRQRSPTGVTP